MKPRHPDYLLEAEKHHLQRWLPDCFGYFLFALTDSLTADDLTTSKIPHHFIAGQDWRQAPDLCVRADALPLPKDSIDLLLLHHPWAGLNDPVKALQEAERVLVGQGQLIIIGFNPYSLAGLWQRAQNTACHGYSLRHLRRLVAKTQLSIEEIHYSCYRPWPLDRRWLKPLRFLEALGPILWPQLGAVYAIRLRKTTACLTPISPKRQPSLWRNGMRPSPTAIVPPNPLTKH